MAFLIRPAREGDVPGITEVELTAGRTSPAAAWKFGAGISAAIMDSHRLVLVAEPTPDVPGDGSSAVVGWAKTHYWEYPDGPAPAGYYLGGITVARRFRRQGVAAALTEGEVGVDLGAGGSGLVCGQRPKSSVARPPPALGLSGGGPRAGIPHGDVRRRRGTVAQGVASEGLRRGTRAISVHAFAM